MILSAPALTWFQRCPRILKHREVKTPHRWRPRELFEVHLRSAVLALSSGSDKERVTKELAASFLGQCANPGLDVTCRPYTLAKDWTAILANVIEALSRMSLLKVTAGPTIVLGSELKWECKSFVDDSGVLHRWTAVDKLDADAVSRELHSWNVDGDRCAAQVPMQLHVVEIGRQSGDHQSTPWARIYKHPTVINRFAFQKSDGTPLEGAWKAAWFQDSDKNKPSDWVDIMVRDKVSLIHHLDVKGPTESQCAEFTKQVGIEAERIRAQESLSWCDLPMFRPACDIPTCQYQNSCYRK